MANSLYRTGSFEINNQTATIKQLEGRLTFINHIQRYNNSIDEETHKSWNLNSKENNIVHFFINIFANENHL